MGWWLSQNDRAGEALAWNAREPQVRILDLELKKLTMPVSSTGSEVDVV